MDKTEKLCHDGYCRDGAFMVIFCENKITKYFLLGKRKDDNLWELLGGGFDVRDNNPKNAAVREVYEEGGISFEATSRVVFFAHMVQKVPRLGEGEMGHVFFFYKKVPVSFLKMEFNPSEESTEVRWHSLEEILAMGESEYRTSTLRTILRFLRYREEKEVQFGVLREKVRFNGYEF
ncbi:MAG: NUDIX hydrolase [Candidatus Paceibacteria bacterium]